MKKSNQSGGIVSFALATVALVGLFAGGLYLSLQQGRSASEVAQAPAPAGRNSENQVDDNTDQPPQDNPQNSPAQNTAPTNRPAAPAPAPAQNSSPTTPTDRVATTGPSDFGSGTDVLPATGAGEIVVTILVLMTLTLAGYHAVSARRAKIGSALKHPGQ